MQSKQSDNSYEAEIVTIDGEKFAKIIGSTGDVYISVTTDMEGSAKVAIKAEDIILSRELLVCSARNNIEGIITGMEEMDNNYRLVVNIGVPLTVNVTKRSVQELDFKLGDTVYCVFKSMAVMVV